MVAQKSKAGDRPIGLVQGLQVWSRAVKLIWCGADEMPEQRRKAVLMKADLVLGWCAI